MKARVCVSFAAALLEAIFLLCPVNAVEVQRRKKHKKQTPLLAVDGSEVLHDARETSFVSSVASQRGANSVASRTSDVATAQVALGTRKTQVCKTEGKYESDGGVLSDHPKFVIASSSSSGQVVYTRIPISNTATPLIETGLIKPMGLATYSNYLYVADYDGKKVVRYALAYDGSKLKATLDATVAENVNAADVAVDSFGVVFFTDKGDIYEVDEAHPAAPKSVYKSANLAELSSVESIFADNFNIYWANGASGGSVGTILRATQKRPQFAEDGSKPPGLKVLTTEEHSDGTSAMGVCGVGSQLFFTGGGPSSAAESGTLTQANKAQAQGSAVYPVDSSLTQPHHCAWDKDGSILVADNSGVWRYAGVLSKSQVGMMGSREQLFDLVGAHGVEVFHAARVGPVPRDHQISGRVLVVISLFAATAVMVVMMIAI